MSSPQTDIALELFSVLDAGAEGESRVPIKGLDDSACAFAGRVKRGSVGYATEDVAPIVRPKTAKGALLTLTMTIILHAK